MADDKKSYKVIIDIPVVLTTKDTAEVVYLCLTVCSWKNPSKSGFIWLFNMFLTDQGPHGILPTDWKTLSYSVSCVSIIILCKFISKIVMYLFHPGPKFISGENTCL